MQHLGPNLLWSIWLYPCLIHVITPWLHVGGLIGHWTMRGCRQGGRSMSLACEDRSRCIAPASSAHLGTMEVCVAFADTGSQGRSSGNEANLISLRFWLLWRSGYIQTPPSSLRHNAVSHRYHCFKGIFFGRVINWRKFPDPPESCVE